MKKLLFVWILIFSASCSSPTKQPKPAEPQTASKEDEEVERLQRAVRERESWSLSKMEEHYEGLKLQPFYFLNELLNHALKEKNWDKAEVYANDFLSTAQKFKSDWNHGNAIFYGNLALAGVAIKHEDKKAATRLIKRASLSPGSPQLGSFGPFNNQLYTSILTEIYNSGERRALIEFAKNCKHFITKNDPQVSKWSLDQIDRYIDQVSKNQAPDYKRPE